MAGGVRRENLKEKVLVDDGARHSSREVGQKINQDVLEVPEGDRRAEGPGGVHGAASERASGKGTHDNCKADGKRCEGSRQRHLQQDQKRKNT